MLAVGVQGVMLVVCLASGTAGESRGACETLGILALALPAVTGWLLYSVVRVLPRRRFFEHGLDAPLPFPTKFVATSAVQGVAAGALYGAMFLVLGKASNLSWEGAAAEIAGAVLLFLTALFLRLDFNRFIYKVAFPFVAAGFLLVGGRWVGIEAGAAILHLELGRVLDQKHGTSGDVGGCLSRRCAVSRCGGRRHGRLRGDGSPILG